MFESFQESQNNSTAVDKTFTSFDLNDTGNIFCQATVPVSAAGTNQGDSVGIFLPENDIRFACSRETTMMGKRYQFINRQITDSATTTIDYLDRCIKNRLGAFANTLEIGGVWSIMEKTEYINILELKAVYNTL